jgi:hypothetical protein
LVVVALGDAADVAWGLAQAVYAREALRPTRLDEDVARALAGDTLPSAASTRARDLAQMREAVRGDDAPSRALLRDIASQTGARGVVLVATPPRARVFDVERGAFEAAFYEPMSSGSAEGAWTPAVDAFGARYAAANRAVSVGNTQSADASNRRVNPDARAETAPPPARASTRPSTDRPSTDRQKDANERGGAPSRPFYASPWLWGALGAAAATALIVYVASRDNRDDTIHLHVQVPK